jgi:hypothetical protein
MPGADAGTVELPDDPKRLRQLRGPRAPTPERVRDLIDHRSGEQDDRADAETG